jgi:tripartite-type tricarboxylate transporter receptor subunit TctC
MAMKPSVRRKAMDTSENENRTSTSCSSCVRAEAYLFGRQFDEGSLKRIAFAILLLLCATAVASAQTNFYENKTMRLVLGFSAGGISDLWGRALARAMSPHIPGRPQIILQNMPGAGSLTAANYVYNVAKPDGLTIAFFTPGLFFNQLIGAKEVQFDWARFVWIGSPEQTQRIIYIRNDTPFKSIDDVRAATEGPRCGATALGTVGHYFPRLVEEVLGVKFNIVIGYPGAAEIDLAIQKNEVQCRAGSLEGYFGGEPSKSWAKTGFTRVLINGGAKRDPRIADVPTLSELMEQRKVSDSTRRLASVLVSPDQIGRPLATTPGTPPERVKMLRDAFKKALAEPEFIAEAKTRGWQVEPVSGEELEAIAKKVVVQPPEVIERMKKILSH